jgi:hypothetical protein
MNKKSQEILYCSEEENEPVEQQEQIQPEPMPQNIKINAPKPQRVSKAKINTQQPEIKEIQQPIPQEKQTFQCQLCNKQFARNYYLNRHVDEGRCSVKRNMDLARQKQMEENERLILEKMKKRDLRLAKKEAKQSQPIKQVKKQIQSRQPPQRPQTPPPRPQAPAPRQHQTPFPNFIINF